MSKKLTKEEFIKRSNLIHNEKYDYSLVEYVNIDNKVKIICLKHGLFEQIAYHHLSGHGCSECIGRKKYNTEIFITESKKIHKEKYDYNLVEYKNICTKIKIICPIHGVFEQIPNSHLIGKGCKKCGNNTKKTIEQFLEEVKLIHGDEYDYSLVEYVNTNKKVKIICPKHGVYLKEPKVHIGGGGCPICKSSVGERKIDLFLKESNIKYFREYSFDDCRFKLPLRFDFYLPNHNVCIEFDGDQHFVKFDFEDNDDDLKIRKIRDNIKNKYCEKHNIHLIRINGKQSISKKLSFLINI